MTQPPAITAARALLTYLVRSGVRDVVLSPGSRSAPLAYAALSASDAGLIDLHVRVDERDAAFVALGLARGTGAPVAVVTTSGTAVANLHPAVLEAHHSGVPLVLLTADRPAEKRGTGANQTTDQRAIFGPAVRYAADIPAPDGRAGEIGEVCAIAARALAAATGVRDRNPGPVQLNLAYRPPLVPGAALPVGDEGSVDGVPETPRPPRVVALRAHCDDRDAPTLHGPGLVVAGDGAGPLARQLAAAQGWPLVAEPSSGAVGGPHAIPAAALVLPHMAFQGYTVVVLGRPTLTRAVQALLADSGVRLVVVAPNGRPWTDEWANAADVLPAVPESWLAPVAPTEAGRRFLDQWQSIGRAAAGVLAEHLTGGPLHGLAIAHLVTAASGSEDALVVGSSSPVRDLDLVGGLDGSEPPLVIANRGVAGIDGMVSTAIGVALARTRGGLRTRALLGDLTFLHDVGGLLRGPDEPPVDLQIVVVNDGGGSIFETLEPGAWAARNEAPPGAHAEFERVFATPHAVQIAALCAGYGVGYTRVADRDGLRAALDSWRGGLGVVEVSISRAQRRPFGRDLAAAVAAAVRSAAPADCIIRS